VRRAIAQDLERTCAPAVTDMSTVLTIRLDEVVRQVDELPLLSAPPVPRARRPAQRARAAAALRCGLRRRRLRHPRRPPPDPAWTEVLGERWAVLAPHLGRGAPLVRVTPIDQPEAMLLAPEQAFFLRENLKLRLLNARLALLSASSTPRSPTCATRSRRWSATSTAAPRTARRHRPAAQVSAQARQVACRGPTPRWRPSPPPGGAEARGPAPHARHHLAGAAVRGGRGGRHHAGPQRRPGQHLLARLAHRPVAEPVRLVLLRPAPC
jgi:uroporphyrin-III C-methyltransferase